MLTSKPATVEAIPRRASQAGGGRIPALDGLRAIASLVVVIYHFGPHIVREPDSQFRFLLSLPSFDEGVTLFFVLSGFLISGILVDARNSKRYFQTFYIRRALRIFPLYYLVLISYALTLLVPGATSGSLKTRLFEDPLPLWPYFVYLQNFAMTAASTYGAYWMAGSWSLAVEEQFYLTLPLFIRKCSERSLAWLAAAGLAGPFLIRAATQKLRLWPAIGNRVLLLTALDALAAGIMVMLLVRHYRPWFEARRTRIGRIVLLMVGTWLVYPNIVTNPRYAFLWNLVTSLVCAAVLLYVLIAPDGIVGKFLSLRWMRLLGNMAYCTYLLHPILLCLSFRLLEGRDPFLTTPRDLVPVGAALLATLLLSYASWRLLESRLIHFGHRWKY
jgi:peptidoglycan/LPS O-acetylase OafA/YrhL